MTFQNGDRIRRIRDGQPWAPLGFETTVVVTDRVRYVALEGDHVTVMNSQWELVSKQKSEPKGFAKWVKEH